MSEISPQDETPLEEIRERRDLIAELKGHITRAHDGDEGALANMETALEQIPSIARKFGNLNLLVEEGFIERTTANDPFRQKSLKVNLVNMREELAGPNASPLEKLGAGSVLLASTPLC